MVAIFLVMGTKFPTFLLDDVGLDEWAMQRAYPFYIREAVYEVATATATKT